MQTYTLLCVLVSIGFQPGVATMNEHTRAVHDALALYSKLAGNPPYAKATAGTGFRAADRFFNYPSGIVMLHDWVEDKPWCDQCAYLAYVLGPTKHARVLMALSWGMYDGWRMYTRIHRRAPVDTAAYWQAIIASDDLEETVKQEF